MLLVKYYYKQEILGRINRLLSFHCNFSIWYSKQKTVVYMYNEVKKQCNFGGCSVGITDGLNLWGTPLTWPQMARYTYGYPETKFWWATEKKKDIYFQTIYIAILRTYLTLLFDIVSTIADALVIAGHQFLYPCIVEWCTWDANHALTASLTSLSSWNCQPPRKVFKCRNT
jgi:hypothetical protein